MNDLDKKTTITEPNAVTALKAIYDNNGPGDLMWKCDVPGQVSATDDSIFGHDGDLWDLYISDKKLHGVLTIHNISTLESISAWGNAFKGVDLNNLSKLNYLDLDENEIESLVVMDNLPVLEFLSLTGNKIKEFTALAGLKSLRKLFLGENPLKDISALFELHPDLLFRMAYPEVNPECGLKCVFRQLQDLDARIITDDEEDENDLMDWHGQDDISHTPSLLDAGGQTYEEN